MNIYIKHRDRRPGAIAPDQSMAATHSDGTAVKATETILPPRQLQFLLDLERLESTDAVWEAILAFAASIGLHCVDYVFATDFRNWERAQFIRTTFHSRWLEYVKQFPHIRHTSNF